MVFSEGTKLCFTNVLQHNPSHRGKYHLLPFERLKGLNRRVVVRISTLDISGNSVERFPGTVRTLDWRGPPSEIKRSKLATRL